MDVEFPEKSQLIPRRQAPNISGSEVCCHLQPNTGANYNWTMVTIVTLWLVWTLRTRLTTVIIRHTRTTPSNHGDGGRAAPGNTRQPAPLSPRIVQISAVKRSTGSTITEKAPTRAFSWLKAPTSAFTFKTLLRHYAERALTPS